MHKTESTREVKKNNNEINNKNNNNNCFYEKCRDIDKNNNYTTLSNNDHKNNNYTTLNNNDHKNNNYTTLSNNDHKNNDSIYNTAEQTRNSADFPMTLLHVNKHSEVPINFMKANEVFTLHDFITPTHVNCSLTNLPSSNKHDVSKGRQERIEGGGGREKRRGERRVGEGRGSDGKGSDGRGSEGSYEDGRLEDFHGHFGSKCEVFSDRFINKNNTTKIGSYIQDENEILDGKRRFEEKKDFPKKSKRKCIAPQQYGEMPPKTMKSDWTETEVTRAGWLEKEVINEDSNATSKMSDDEVDVDDEDEEDCQMNVFQKYKKVLEVEERVKKRFENPFIEMCRKEETKKEGGRGSEKIDGGLKDSDREYQFNSLQNTTGNYNDANYAYRKAHDDANKQLTHNLNFCTNPEKCPKDERDMSESVKEDRSAPKDEGWMQELKARYTQMADAGLRNYLVMLVHARLAESQALFRSFFQENQLSRMSTHNVDNKMEGFNNEEKEEVLKVKVEDTTSKETDETVNMKEIDEANTEQKLPENKQTFEKKEGNEHTSFVVGPNLALNDDEEGKKEKDGEINGDKNPFDPNQSTSQYGAKPVIFAMLLLIFFSK